MPNASELGPLPIVDDRATLERESIVALQRLLSSAGFIIRDERVADYGVDLSLEAVVDNRGTNFRAQVQMKARSGLSPKSDGTYSLPVAVANLNYLLNGPCPMYVLYMPERAELRFVFARDEQKRLEAASPGWMAREGNVTLRLAQLLDPAALEQLRERIIAEALLNRRIHDALAFVASARPVKLSLELSRPGATTPEQARKTLAESGMVQVSRGLGRSVIELMGVLSADDFRREPKLFLVRGYGEFSNGNYLRADASLREALARRGELHPDDRAFLAFLTSATDVSLGYCTEADFVERSAQWAAGAPPEVAAQYDVMNCWLRLTSAARTPAAKGLAEAHAKVREAISKVLATPGLPAPVAVHARLLSLWLQALDLSLARVQAAAFLREPSLWQQAYDEPPEAVFRSEASKLATWRSQLSEVFRESATLGHLPLYLDIRLGLDICEAHLVSNIDLIASMMGTPFSGVPDKLLLRVRETRRLAAEQDHAEIELRATLVESDLEALRGDEEAARRVAREALDKAEALRLAPIARQARAAATGPSAIATRRQQIAAFRGPAGHDALFAALPDHALAAQADDTCAALRLPAERAPLVEDALRCERQLARERLRWCRHLLLLEADQGADDRGLPFQRAISRFSACEPRHARSAALSQNWAAQIEEFKKEVCADCPHREPFGETSLGGLLDGDGPWGSA